MRWLRFSERVFFGALTCFLLILPSCSVRTSSAKEKQSVHTGVAILLIDTDHPVSSIDKNIYGQFLEHINHSVIDGLYAEQVQGQGFEENDFSIYWQADQQNGSVELVDIPFQKSLKSVRLSSAGGAVGIRQQRLYVQQDKAYNGSLWVKPESGSLELNLRISNINGIELARTPLPFADTAWQEIKFEFTPSRTDTSAQFDIKATGNGSILVDFISIMPKEARAHGKFRPDLLASLKALKPTFIRWPGGSYASTYQWQDGIGPAVSRGCHPNVMWGGYTDYSGLGSDEFLELCRQLEADPLIVLAAPSTKQEDVDYAMNWVHYLIDPLTTHWGKLRADNGHPSPYSIPYIQIDNEPMNNHQSPEQYAEIVNVYGSQLREIAPNSKIVACGQKRSNDLNWSQKVIDLAGKNFDILGCHNYEYEPDAFQTGVQRIADYLVNLDHFIRNSSNPAIQIAVLEWSLCRTYDWRAGLHTAGMLINYERLSPSIRMTCPALLIRNTSDSPEWRSFIYHDHVSWFPGSGYLVEKLFRDYYEPIQLGFTSGTFNDLENHTVFFDDISQMKPEKWTSGTIDAIATRSEDGKRIIIKAVNYKGVANTILLRLQGAGIPANAGVKTYTLKADLNDEASLEHPDAIKPAEGTLPFAKDMSLSMEPYSVVVAEIILE